MSKQIKIKIVLADLQVREIRATKVTPHWAIHPYYDDSDPVPYANLWSVTHIPSGVCLGEFQPYRVANELIKMLRDRKITLLKKEELYSWEWKEVNDYIRKNRYV